jgi:phosphatidylglycerol:prolipoprotein diacylglycerol transferase
MASGRPGCFLTGCCAGRPTSSRWALWSSDRRLGIRRFPVQLVEAVLALLIGLAGLVLVLTVEPPVEGAIFIGAIAAYAFCRQLLFPLRIESHTSRGRTPTMAISGLVLLADMALFTLA